MDTQPDQISPEVLQRMIFSKMLLKSAEMSFSNKLNHMEFGKGVLLLHDSVESALGAIADHLNVGLNTKTYLLDYFDLIDKKCTAHRVPYKKKIRNLNTLRIGIKHQGIFPDINSVGNLHETIKDFLEQVSETYLGLDFEELSLISQIKNEDVKKFIKEAEGDINNDKYEKALIQLGKAMYEISEYSTIGLGSMFAFIADPKKGPRIYTDYYSTEYTVKLLEHGVDPYLYQRFRNLTPKIGVERESKQIVHEWIKDYGHPGNWTRENCKFCVEFCIDTALKFQKERDFGYKLIPYPQVYEDVVEALEDNVEFWEEPKPLPKGLLAFGGEITEEREIVFTLNKGQKIKGFVPDENQEEILLLSDEIPQKDSSISRGSCYVKRAKVKITTVEKEK